jgi:hypothetical protein
MVNSWYLDDGTIIGNEEALNQAIEVFETEGPKRGFFLNRSKSLIWCGSLQPDQYNAFNPPFDLPSDIPRINHRGFDLLGAPIGPASYCEESLLKRIDKLQSILSHLGDLEDSQAEFVLLRFCLSLPKISYSLRTCPSSLFTNALIRYDNIQREALSLIVGHPLNDLAWAQASLPVDMGGMGIRSALSHAPAAYIASRFSSCQLVSKIIGSDHEFNDDAETETTRTKLETLMGKRLQDVGTFPSQRSLSRQIDIRSQESFFASLSSERDKARFNSVSDPHSGDWLKVVPCHALGLALNSSDFKFASLYRLGLPLFPNSSRCPSCQHENDFLGDHAVGCGGDKDRIARHDRLRDAIFNAAQNAALAPQMEVSGLIPGSNARPADVFLSSWENGRAAAVDVTVISPLQSTLVRDSAAIPGYALQVAENRKRQAYEESLGRGTDLIPVAVDTFGRWSQSSLGFINRLGMFLRLREAGSAAHLFQRLSVLIQKGNGALWCRRAPSASTFVSGWH